jgi:hypothetical protein
MVAAPLAMLASTAWTTTVPAHAEFSLASQVWSVASKGVVGEVMVVVPVSNVPRYVTRLMGPFVLPSTWMAIVLVPSASTELGVAVTVSGVAPFVVGLFDDEQPTARPKMAAITGRGRRQGRMWFP